MIAVKDEKILMLESQLQQDINLDVKNSPLKAGKKKSILKKRKSRKFQEPVAEVPVNEERNKRNQKVKDAKLRMTLIAKANFDQICYRQSEMKSERVKKEE
jgi:hypothetical protein